MASRSNVQQVELELRGGIYSHEAPKVIGPRLRKATNALWNYRYPRTGVAAAGPYFLRMPTTFPYQAATAFTGAAGRWYDIAFTQHTTTANRILYMGAGAGSPPAYEVWPGTGGTKLTYHASTAAMTVANSSVPGCSVYWETPGTHPKGGATTGTIDIDYNAAGKTMTRATGDFLADGFAIGDTVTVADSTSNNGTYTVTVLTATVMTVSQTVVDEVSGTSSITLDTDLAAGVGALIFSHPYGNNIFYLLDSDTQIRSLETVTNCPTTGATALAVHLDRLWLATVPSAFSGANISHVWYTDPLDLGSIRTTNVFPVRGRVTCLIPGQHGAIDASGVAHLIIGTDTAVHVLDGDPFLGNATLRTLTMGHGIAGNVSVAQTPWGVYYCGTDHQLHWIPTGASETIPVGEPILDKLGMAPVSFLTDQIGSRELSALAWFDPYLYLWPGGDMFAGYILLPGREGPQAFWGPVVPSTQYSNTMPAVIRAAPVASARFAPSAAAGRHSVHMIQHAASSPLTSAFDEGTTETGVYPNGGLVGRTASVTTGIITVPVQRVQATRIVIETIRLPEVAAADVQWTVTVTPDVGSSVTCTRMPVDPIPESGNYDPELQEVQRFTVPPLPPDSRGRPVRGFSVTISCTATSNLGLQRAFVEFHVSPAQVA
jgi:hypothetical protein